MKKFWTYISNGRYSIGCTGQSVYVYDSDGMELARFRDIRYAYNAAFCPTKNIVLIKSSGAYFAVYSLDTLCLLKKIKYSDVDGAQDDGFCFSGDGRFFYNVERQGSSIHSVISVYDTATFERVNMFLKEDDRTEASFIECDAEDQIFVLGFFRGEEGVMTNGFVSKLDASGLAWPRVIPEEVFDFYWEFKSLELMGFTEKAKQWSGLKHKNGIEHKRYPLSELWENFLYE